MLTFRTKEEKAIDIWALIVLKQPMSILDLAKILYIADKEHFNDYGRSLYGENYLAGPNGPIPITLKNYIDKNYSFSPVLENNKYSFSIANNTIQSHIYPRMESLSKSDIKVLESAFEKVIVDKNGTHLDILDNAWYQTPIHTVIDWKLVLEEELTEEQLEDIIFQSRHSA